MKMLALTPLLFSRYDDDPAAVDDDDALFDMMMREAQVRILRV